MELAGIGGNWQYKICALAYGDPNAERVLVNKTYHKLRFLAVDSSS